MRVLLVAPPLTDPATPYPSICYLAGFLDSLGVQTDLADASLALMLRLFTPRGLDAVRNEILSRGNAESAVLDPRESAFLRDFQWYADTVETAVGCLRHTDSASTRPNLERDYFPPAMKTERATQAGAGISRAGRPREQSQQEHRNRLAAMQVRLRSTFASPGDLVRSRASVVLHDLARVIRAGCDPEFRLQSYAEQLSNDLATFEPIRDRLERHPSVIDRLIDEIAAELSAASEPEVVGLTVPFPGALLGALRIARCLKALNPGVHIVLGGGWVNTTLRHLTDPGIFDYVDFITLDDGERPLQCVLELLQGQRGEVALLRTFVRRAGRVIYLDGAAECDVPFAKTGYPTYRGLPLRQYFTYSARILRHDLDRTRWNKLTLAHGCYWKKCAFCDTTLDYIARYEPATVDMTVERIRRLVAETGDRGFHFVDEAMPPALMRRLAERLIDEELGITWWGNVRFDEAIAQIAPLLSRAGCRTLTGGLEVASDRLLTLMQKGVSLEQVVRVTSALSRAGVTVHAYLIYGFPTQTVQETIDALEYVRQLFEADCLHSVMWHRFVLTASSPIATRPEQFGIRLPPAPRNPFSNYVLQYEEPGAANHDQFRQGLKDTAAAYMSGLGLDRPVHTWFAGELPPTTLAPDCVRQHLARADAITKTSGLARFRTAINHQGLTTPLIEVHEPE